MLGNYYQNGREHVLGWSPVELLWPVLWWILLPLGLAGILAAVERFSSGER